MSVALNLEKASSASMSPDMFAGQSFMESVIHMDAAAITGAQILTAVLIRYSSYDKAVTIANVLLKEYGNVACVLNATRERIFSLVDISFEAWATLQIMRKLAGVILREPLNKGPLLRNLAAIYDYLMFTIGHDKSESCRILYLDAHNYLIKDEVHSTGTLDCTAFYPREIVVRTCELGARAVILAHNHPSGDMEPSQDDHAVTALIREVLESIGASLHDHLIIGPNRYFSFRESGFIG